MHRSIFDQETFSGDFISGGAPEACDESKSLYCVAKMTMMDEEILEARFFCDDTTVKSECTDSLSGCTEPLQSQSGKNKTRVCCCAGSNCNSPAYMLRRSGDPSKTGSFPGSPMLLYILLIVFGCIVLLGLVMMAGKQCGGSSADSVDFDDKASFDRLDFEENDNNDAEINQPGTSSVSCLFLA